MKKQLLCTSAIALGVAAAPASAQDWNLDWGGFFQQHIAYADVSTPGAADFDGVQMFTNAEIIFTPNITLDNGMTFGINVQMEALNSGGGADGIDEAYMSISSDTFGRIDAGFENSAGYKMMVGAPQVGSMAINSPSASAFIPFTGFAGGQFRQAGLSSYTEVAGNNDVARITYYTPSFSGFTAGISYAPSAAGNAANAAPVNRNVGLVDIFDIGVNYSQSFGTTDITLAARWGTGDSKVAGTSDPETWGVGFQVGFSGFTFGAAYAENDNAVANTDQQGYSVGVAYDAAGPWTFGLEAYIGEIEDGSGVTDDHYEYYKLAANRDLGPGVSWTTYLLYGETRNDSLVNGDIDGTAIGTAINLSF
ncbi:porin [Roseovarius sp.]|uniref:porin n=1 Tax=Roseovarius sp. TaxID=1486281 RepID=UPI003D11041A